MSQWTTLSLILTLGLILVDLSAEAAAAADDLPRNIELKPGAAVSDEKRATDTNTSDGKTRQIVTEAAAAKETAPTDPAAAPAPQSLPRRRRRLRLRRPAASRRKRLRRDPLPWSSSLASLLSQCRPSSSASAAIPTVSMACGAAARARRSPRSAISPRSTSPSSRQRLGSSP